MLTRIISGAAIILIVAALVCVHSLLNFPYLLVLVLALAAATATYEIGKNAKLVNKPIFVWISSVWTGLQFVSLCLNFNLSIYLSIIFVLAVAVLTLFNYGKITNSEIFSSIALPIILGFAFFCVYALLQRGLIYLLFVLNFSAVCDCGAYFVGVTMGKHKLCEKISPKKTVEGAVGGILSSLIVTAILCLCFGIAQNMLPLIIMTPILCVVGMIGDLFASTIKRNADIKDYGNLIPGHGGITDRFDSILLIAPVFILLLNIF